VPKTAKKTAPKKTAPKKTEAPALVIPLLTKPRGGVAKKGTPKVEVLGHEKTADAIRERQVEIDSLTAEQKIDKDTLVGVCVKARIEAETHGLYSKTCEVATTGDKPVQVVFSDKYSQIGLEHETSLKSALGDSYEDLFERKASVKPRGELNLIELRIALGDKFDAFCALFDVTEYLGAKKGLMDTRFALRRKLDDNANHVVDAVVEQVRYTPAVKAK